MNSPDVDLDLIAKAVDVLGQGGLVAMPTETVYGLAANADDESAVRRTFEAKGRPMDHPLIVHVSGPEAIDAWAEEVPAAARLLAQHFWPGPLTMVLKKKARCGYFVTGGQETVALRCPSHPVALALLKAFSGPTYRGLTAPSCNTFGRISPSTAQHVLDDLGVKPTGKLDLILDGGACEFGIESTMINLSSAHPSLLRHGVITRAMLEEVLGCEVPDAGHDAPRASGRLKSHYAPKTKLTLLPSETFFEQVQAFEGRVAVMASEKVLQSLAPLKDKIVLALPASAGVREYGRDLYEALHQLDAAGAQHIFIEQPMISAEWAAVNDRLERASA